MRSKNNGSGFYLANTLDHGLPLIIGNLTSALAGFIYLTSSYVGVPIILII